MFLAMLEKRQSSQGQSMLLAVAKWIGTLAPLGIVSMNYGTSEFQSLIITLGIFCSVYDLMYIYLLGKRIKEEKGSVWHRFFHKKYLTNSASVSTIKLSLDFMRISVRNGFFIFCIHLKDESSHWLFFIPLKKACQGCFDCILPIIFFQ